MKAPKLGHLRAAPSRANGKVIDTWSFSSPAPGVKGGSESIEVEVALMHGAKGLHFQARVAGMRETFENADIECLRAEVEMRLSESAGIRAGVVWEDWLEVSVSAHDEERQGLGSLRGGLTVEVKPVKRGVHLATGKVYGLNGSFAVPFPSAKVATGEVDRRHKDEAGFRFDSDTEVSYVPDTQANRAALQEIRDRMRVLRMLLSEALRHDSILVTLADVSAKLPLLAGPSPDPSTCA